ncbi:MAG: polyprenyl synthetase family protein [Spirochaetota bacterium]
MDLKTIYKPISYEVGQVEKEMKAQLEQICTDVTSSSCCQKFLVRVIHHIFNIPGKRLRPALVLLSARSANPHIQNMRPLIRLSVAVELIHTASLIHDDIIDESKTRRKQRTLNEKFDNKIAVLVGDILYSQFFSILANLPVDKSLHSKLLNIFCGITQKMCFGEIFEHKIKYSCGKASFNDYVRVIENKTACLMAASCQSGGLLSGADETTTNELKNYGLDLGVLYQIVDDYIDQDSILSGDIDLKAKAREVAEQAAGHLDALEETIYRKKLVELAEYVLEKSVDTPAVQV